MQTQPNRKARPAGRQLIVPEHVLSRAMMRAWVLSETRNQTPGQVWAGLSLATKNAMIRDVTRRREEV
jgi:hypothetical protein